MYKDNVMKIGRFVLLMLASVSVFRAGAADVAVCTWKGSASGGNWQDPNNWKIVRNSGYEALTDAEVMASYCKWVISALSGGARLLNTSSSLKIGNLDFNTADKGTVILDDQDGAAFIFGQDAQINIASGNTIDCRMRQSNWEQLGKVVVNGAGTFSFNPNARYFTYKRNYQPCGSATIRLANSNVDWANSYIQSWGNGKLEVDADVTVGRVIATSESNKKKMIILKNGRTLSLGSAETASDSSVSMYMGASGIGNLTLWGGQDYTWAGALNYTGSFRLIDGLVNYSGSSVPKSVAMDFDGGGTMKFSQNQTLGVLSGDGATGGIVMSGGNALAVSGSDSVTSSQFDARISGNVDFVKEGTSYDLTLTGDNAWKGDTHVKAGTLGIKRCNYRHGLVANWTFDDADNLGADSGPGGIPLTLFGKSAAPRQIQGGIDGRPAIHLSSAETSDYQAFRVDGARMTAANGFSKEGGALAVSFWMKPNLEKCGSTAYVFRRGIWYVGTEFMLWLDGSTKKLRLSIDNYAKTDDSLNIYASVPTIGDGQWHHIVASYEKQELKLWYDGKLLASQKTSKALALEKERDADWNQVVVPDTQSLIFGNHESNPNHRFDAFVDDVCVWNHALTAVEVEREYNLRSGIAKPSDLLPDPIAHWRFDDETDIGKDEMGRSRLVANNDMSNPATATLSSAYSPMGKALNGGCSLMVEGGGYPVGLPIGRNPVTVSIRLMAKGATEWGSIVYWGTNEKEKLFRLGYGGSPRRFHASYRQTGNGADVTAVYTDSNRQADHSWVHYVVTYNPMACILKIYRDGVLESTGTTAWANIPASGKFYVNWRTGQSGASASAIDDLRIYDRELTAYEVKSLARSLKSGNVGPVLPNDSVVTVDDGAVFRAEGMHVVSNSICGAGNVTVAGGSRFGSVDWSQFTGSVTGDGELVVAKGSTGPLKAKSVLVPVSFEDNTIVLSLANRETPLVQTDGKIILPESGHIVAEAGSESIFAGSRLFIGKCSGYTGPTDTKGWTFDPAKDGRKGRFVFANGALWMQMNGGGTVMVLR